MKSYVKRCSSTTSPGLRNESPVSVTDFGHRCTCSQCSSAGHHYAGLLHEAVWRISFMSTFDSRASAQALLTATFSSLLLAKPVATFLNHTSNQEVFGYPALSQHPSRGFPWCHLQPREGRGGPWAEDTPGHRSTKTQCIFYRACFYNPLSVSTEGKIRALYTLSI